ncbi:MAG: hypothetical protein F6K35_50940, partial [Okeania sp. SIO2H7]|nr:hypothetical protein [Okeania sp. SIO2H7]
MPEAVRHASVSLAPFVQDACDLRHDLKWQQTYSANDLSPLFLERYGWSMLVGPDAPVESTSILSGLLLLGP